MENTVPRTVIRGTFISEHFIALPANEGFTFAGHPYGRKGIISLAKAIRKITSAHPCLTRRGELWAADETEAKAVLSSLEGALGT